MDRTTVSAECCSDRLRDTLSVLPLEYYAQSNLAGSHYEEARDWAIDSL